MTVAFAARALRDLRAMDTYLRSRSPQGADAVLRNIEATIDLIVRHPLCERKLAVRPRVRSLSVARYLYRIYYSTDVERVLILHIRHTARRPPRGQET
jgi:toxin ParE1/3/4